MPATSLDIVLPCFKPQPGWEDKIIQKFRELCNALPSVQIRIILVDDGTVPQPDPASFKKIKDSIYFFKHISLPENHGKGYALREGIKISEAEIVIYTDVDFPYTIESIIRIWKELENYHADIAAGILDEHYYKNVPAGRMMLSRMLRFMNRSLLRTKISDTQRGLKGFNEKGKKIFLQTTIDRYLFDLEFIYLASKRKNEIRLKGVEVQLSEDVRFTRMKTSVVLKEGFNFGKLFLRSIFGR